MPLLENGQIFERYRIVRELGNGVAGVSYEAEDRELQRKATLKIIHPWAALPDSARRQFFREMQGISTLNHPYLATVLDYGESEGHMYLARRYVSSGSLLSSNGRLWFQPPLPVASAFTYAHQLAQVLHYIHQNGYIHGALTFANVLVLRGPNTEQEADYAPFLLADIGLAHFARRFGSPQIEALPVSAAPEQMGKRVTAASDQFALAVLLYFWLTGRPPYLGSPDEVEHLKLTQKIPPLSTLNPGTTEEHDAIFQRALTAYPEERYPSVLAFTEALLASLIPSAPSPPPAISLLAEPPETPRDILIEALPTLSTLPNPLLTSEVAEDEQANAANHLQADNAPNSAMLPTPELDVNRQATPLPTNAQLTPASQDATITQPASEHASHVEQSTHQNSILLPDEMDTSAMAASTGTLTNAHKKQEEPEVDETAQLLQHDPLVPRLLISSPYARRTAEFLLTKEATNVGRASANDLLLNDDNLTSRYHALFKRVDAHVLVFDKHSNNGVFVNGQRIEAEQDCELVDGDHISIGSYELIYRAAQPKQVIQLI
jgi:serine/threonine protein kinase